MTLQVRMELAEVNDTECIIVTAPRTTYDQMKKVPGAQYLSRDDKWAMSKSWASCMVMRDVFGRDLDISPDLAEWARKWRSVRVQNALDLRTAKDTSFPAAHGDEEWKLYDYQKVGSAFICLNDDGVLVGDDMRVGKSPQIIRAMRHLQESEGDVFPALIVAPSLVKSVWRDMFARWWPDARVAVPKAGIAASEKAVKGVMAGEYDVVVLHYEILALLSRLTGWGSEALKLCSQCDPNSNLQPSKCQVHKKILNEVDWRLIVCDEIHRLGDPSAQMTRAVKYLRKNSRLWGATGTPPEDPDRFWSVMNLVSPPEFPSKSKFQDMFVRTEINPWSGFPESVGWKPDKKPLLESIVFPRFIRRPKKVVHNVVEPERTTIEVDMTPKQAKAYKDLRQTYMAELANGVFFADDPGAKIQRLRQLASAYGEVTQEEREDGSLKIGMILSEPSGKLDAFEELWESLGHDPVVVFAEQAQLIELAALRLGDRTAKLVGGMGSKALDDNVEMFQTGKVDCIVCTTATGGEGISLNRADTLIYLQRPYSMVANKQSEERIYEEGRPSFIFDLQVTGTVEDKVTQSLYAKGRKFEELVRDEETVKLWLK